MATIELVRLFIILTSIVGILVWWHFAATRHLFWLAITPISFFAHMIIFYTAVFLFNLLPPNPLFVNWAAGVRLHSIFTIILLGIQLGLEIKQHGK